MNIPGLASALLYYEQEFLLTKKEIFMKVSSKIGQLFIVGALFTSVYMIGCGSKFETSATKVKPKQIEPGKAAEASNTRASTAATGSVTGISGQSVDGVAAKCAASIQVIPSDLEVFVNLQGVRTNLNTITLEDVQNVHSEVTEISGFFDLFETPQILNLTLNSNNVSTQTVRAYTGSADNNYYMDFQVHGQCLTSMCQSYLLVFESKSADATCADSQVQLALYVEKAVDQEAKAFSFTYLGSNLSFEQIKAEVVQ